ncbi:LOW QUALITY PROTEIN: breast cancer metastasis-suppressor 1 [Osmerus mordax]|uniref:LOW QUALITY PROTEIN: breast cancer metastasis-suppressor 1 n=1 Tax=Osmerus mordax TaxID=8014 RepID=UPI00350F9054
MPVQPSGAEEEMETGREPEIPRANGEMEEEEEEEEEREGEGGEDTMEDSTEERDSDLEESEEEEEEESSELDDEFCERRRGECLDEMSHLETQFQELKDKLFRERVSQVKEKLEEVLTGRAGEFREPLSSLQNHMQLRGQVAGVYKELCLQVIKHKYECEIQGARQHLESERSLLFDAMKTELLENIRRLEEDRQSTDLTSEWWSDEMKGKKCKRKNVLARTERKKKAALVSGPFIVYMLSDVDILEDWTAIKEGTRSIPSIIHNVLSINVLMDCLFLSLSVCQPVCLPTCLSANLSCLTTCLSANLSV